MIRLHNKDAHLKGVPGACPRMLKPKKKTIRHPLEETHDQVQELLEKYCEVKRLFYIHIPDIMLTFLFGKYLGLALNKEGVLYKVLQGARKAVSKYLLGFPDLVILDNGRYLGIEIKTGSGKPRSGQKRVAKRIEVIVVHNFREGKEEIDKFLNLEAK